VEQQEKDESTQQPRRKRSRTESPAEDYIVSSNLVKWKDKCRINVQ